MDRFINARWDYRDTIRMAVVDNGLCPFDIQLAGQHIEHLCDWLSFITARESGFEYAGIVTENAGEHATIYHQYIDDPDSEFWAYAAHETDGNRLIGGSANYRLSKMPLPEHFAGLALHETMHLLGVKHYDDVRSIMNADPYQYYRWQAMLMASDIDTLNRLFTGPFSPLWPSAYGYGNKCIIHIPSIEWQPGSYVAIWLNGRQEDGKWILEATGQDIQHYAGWIGRPVASLKNDVLHIPLRYEKATVEVVAPMIQFTGPSSKVRFEVSEIKPLHIHSASDWVH